ncbi:MAG: prolyl aminopeptidase [Gammaproteobacteria bacterium]|nr:prolyl aminopeptidase [Gammaproteobacteria bacterium]
MLSLYPNVSPYHKFRLPVEDPHELYAEECGRADGLPAVFLHGGPGACCEPYHRGFFNPERYRVVLFDQRGSGRSSPHAALMGNSTPQLVADIERLRAHLGIDRWIVFGGSWGSTLGLAYAQAHPDRVLGLILRGIFLCRKRDIDWFYQDGASRIFPDYWQDFLEPIPPAERVSLMHAYYQRLTGDDEVQRMAAAKAWSVWEGRAATLRANTGVVNHFADPHVALSLARIECHYFVNDCFMTPDQLLRDAHRLRNVPGVIVHGRYDIVCPVEQALVLHQVWPEASLEIVPDAGHSATEPGTIDALVRATDAMADRLG